MSLRNFILKFGLIFFAFGILKAGNVCNVMFYYESGDWGNRACWIPENMEVGIYDKPNGAYIGSMCQYNLSDNLH